MQQMISLCVHVWNNGSERVFGNDSREKGNDEDKARKGIERMRRRNRVTPSTGALSPDEARASKYPS